MSDISYSSKVGKLKHVQQHESGSLFEKGRQYGIDEAQNIAEQADEEIRQLRERAERAELLAHSRLTEKAYWESRAEEAEAERDRYRDALAEIDRAARIAANHATKEE